MCDPSRRFPKMSAMATSLQGPLGDSKALITAPLPRPPLPIKARRIVLSSAAWTCGIATPAKAAPAVNVPLRFRKSRREFVPAGSLRQSRLLVSWLF